MANTTNFGWETPDDTDLVKDGALAMRTLGNAIDTSLVDLKGGTTGQVLSKNTNADMDFTWITQNDADAIQNSIVDAKGDLISATADNTPARLASSGVNGQVLTVDTSTSTGLKWATPAGGKVLQVVQGTYSTETDNSTTTYTDTGLTVSITPSATSSKILTFVTIPTHKTAENADNAVWLRLMRASTSIMELVQVHYTQTALRLVGTTSFGYLDSPNTTSATTYKVQFRNQVAANRARICESGSLATIICLEIGA